MKVICRYPKKLNESEYVDKIITEYNSSIKYAKLTQHERKRVTIWIITAVSSLIEESKKEELEENLYFLAILNSSKKKFESISLDGKDRYVQHYFKDILNYKYNPEKIIEMITYKNSSWPKKDWVSFRPEVQKFYKEYIKEIVDRCIKDLIAANSPNPHAKRVRFKKNIKEVREIPNRYETILSPIKERRAPQALIRSKSSMSLKFNTHSKQEKMPVATEEVETKENIAESVKKRRRLK